MFGQNVYIAETKAYAKGGKAVCTLTDLPRGARIKHIILRLVMDITQNASAIAITSDQLTRFVDTIKVGKRIRMTGLLASNLDWFMSGKDFNHPMPTPGTTAGTYRRYMDYVLPFSDPQAISPGSITSTDRGILQINDKWHPEVTDNAAYTPDSAFKAGYSISKAGRDFSPWVTYNTGAYKRYMT